MSYIPYELKNIPFTYCSLFFFRTLVLVKICVFIFGAFANRFIVRTIASVLVGMSFSLPVVYCLFIFCFSPWMLHVVYLIHSPSIVFPLLYSHLIEMQRINSSTCVHSWIFPIIMQGLHLFYFFEAFINLRFLFFFSLSFSLMSVIFVMHSKLCAY